MARVLILAGLLNLLLSLFTTDTFSQSTVYIPDSSGRSTFYLNNPVYFLKSEVSAPSYPEWFYSDSTNNILIAGDSFTQGLQASDPETDGWAYLLEQDLKTRYGDAGNGVWNFQDGSFNGQCNNGLNKWQKAGLAIKVGNFIGFFGMSLSFIYEGGEVWDTMYCQNLDLFYASNVSFGSGSFMIIADGDTLDTIAAIGAGANAIYRYHINFSIYGQHWVKLSFVSGTWCTLVGALPFSGDNGINSIRLGVAGSSTRSYTNLYLPTNDFWAELPYIRPKLSIVALGINDYINQSTIDTVKYKNNLAAIIDKLNDYGKVILVNSVHFYDAGGPLSIHVYNDCMQHVADSMNVPLVDMHTAFGGTLAAAVAAGWQENADNHPTDSGHQKYYETVLEEVLK